MKDLRQLIRDSFNEYNGKNPEVLDSFYAPDVVFEDPLVRVVGLDRLKEYYQHAYSRVKSVRFEFEDIMADHNAYCAPWRMVIQVSGLNWGRPYSVQGLSKLVFDESGKVIHHRDYFDVGEMVYEHLPVQGFVISQMKNVLRGHVAT